MNKKYHLSDNVENGIVFNLGTDQPLLQNNRESG